MANQDLIPDQSQDLSSVSVCHSGTEHIHDHDSVHKLDSEHVQGLDLECTQDNQGLVQSQSDEHGIASQLQQPEHSQNLEQNGDQLDANDQAQNQDHAYSNNYGNGLALTTTQAFELNLSESNDNQLAIAEGHDNLHEELDLSDMINVQVQPVDWVCTTPPPILQSRALVPSPDHQLTVGQQFPDAQSCRRALREAAIALRFEMQTVKSDKVRFTAQCASEGCSWRIHCAKLPGFPTFTIRTIREPHTCAGLTHLGHQQASVQWIANSVEKQLRENPNCKPKEILEEIHRVHGIALSYKQAWRGKERIMAAVRGSFEEDYRLLPQYCDQLIKSNPGSIAVVYGNPIDGCFQRLFISFQASIHGFLNACRPLIGLDSVPLKTEYIATLLLATGYDGDGGLYPLAFGVVDKETDDNWMWFLSELHSLLEANAEHMPMLSILSNRQKGIVDGVEMNFPTAFHGFCMHYLSESFQQQFNNPVFSKILWEAAFSLTMIEFETKILEIEEMSLEAAEWIRRIPPQLWATAYFEGTRLGQLTANIIDCMNTLIVEASGLPIIQMMECIRRQLMTMFNERREASSQWSSILVPSAEKQVSEAIEETHKYQVLRQNEAEFAVTCNSESGQNVVDIRTRCCSCYGWQRIGLPCSHAVAVLLSCRQNVHRFAESYFTVANYRKAYSQTVHPIPDKALWNKSSGSDQQEGDCKNTSMEIDKALWNKSSGSDQQEGDCTNTSMEIVMKINPPKSMKAPAQPRKKRTPSTQDSGGRTKRVVHCSRCNQTGHFRPTCSVPM